MYLSWIDYGILAVLLCLSAGIGIYHGCIHSRQMTTNEFLVADGRMRILPTAMSLLATIMSAASLIGVPVEIYTYGTIYLYHAFAWIIASFFTAKIFVPKFRQMGSANIYSYLEKRFSLPVRIAVTIVFVLIYMLNMGVILYGPSVIFSQVTGLHPWLAVISCGLVCTLYTSIGGMKAVIWTDVIQIIIMFLGVILSVIFGFIDAGGVKKVFQTAINGGRIHFWTINLDPSARYTVWSIIIGGSLYFMATFACLQTQAQRFLCVKSTRAAQRVIWTNCILFTVMLCLTSCIGLLLYAKYEHCDPFRAKIISKPDQLYPLFVMQTFGKIPGLTGLFIAGILSASLSTISSGINSIATVILEDIYKRIRTSSSLSDKRQAVISKSISVFMGFLTICLAFFLSRFGNNILVMAFQIAGSLIPPILGVYLLGFFAPRINSRSVLVAFILSLVFQVWVLIGATLTMKQRIKNDGRLPLSIDGCSSSINSSLSILTIQKSNPLLPLYSISFLWYSANGVFLTILLSFLGTLVFGSNDSKSVDASLLVSWKDIFCCGKSEKSTTDRSTAENNEDVPLENRIIEEERMLETQK